MSQKHFIPEGWKRVSLDKVADIQTGLAIGKKNIKKPVSLPYLRVANVQDGYLDLTEIKTTEISKDEVERYTLKIGDVLMTEGGDYDKLGRGFVWEGQVPLCLHQNHVFSVRTDKKVLNPYFLSYQAGCSYGKGYFLNCAKQSTNLASINSSQLKEYPVLLPDKAIQEEIVSIINRWRDAIGLLDKLIDTKRNFLYSLSQQYLSGFSRVGNYGSEWKKFFLGEIFTNRVENNYDDLPLASITADRGIVLRGEVVRKDTSSADKSKYLRICPGDIGYNTMRMWQGVSALSSIEGIVSPAYTVVTPDESVDGEFMALLFKHPPIIHLFLRHSQGLVDDTLNLKYENFSKIQVSIPEKNEQQNIVRILVPFINEIHLLEEEIDLLKKQKQGLMQQLLTGQLAVGKKTRSSTVRKSA